jgi:hypothetical protein
MTYESGKQARAAKDGREAQAGFVSTGARLGFQKRDQFEYKNYSSKTLTKN